MKIIKSTRQIDGIVNSAEEENLCSEHIVSASEHVKQAIQELSQCVQNEGNTDADILDVISNLLVISADISAL